MIIIIGNLNKKTTDFIKKSKFSKKMIVVNKMCNIKYIKEDVEVIIPYEIILNSGIVSNTLVHLEELIITLNVKKIYYTNSYNHKIMNYLSSTYNVPVTHLNLDSNTNLNF